MLTATGLAAACRLAPQSTRTVRGARPPQPTDGRIDKASSRPDALTRVARAFVTRSSGFPCEKPLRTECWSSGKNISRHTVRKSASVIWSFARCGLRLPPFGREVRRAQRRRAELPSVVRTEASYTYRIGQTVMRFGGERRRGERGEVEIPEECPSPLPSFANPAQRSAIQAVLQVPLGFQGPPSGNLLRPLCIAWSPRYEAEDLRGVPGMRALF